MGSVQIGLIRVGVCPFLLRFVLLGVFLTDLMPPCAAIGLASFPGIVHRAMKAIVGCKVHIIVIQVPKVNKIVSKHLLPYLLTNFRR